MKTDVSKTIFAIAVLAVAAVTCFFAVFSVAPNVGRYFGVVELEDYLPVVDVRYDKEYPFEDASADKTARMTITEKVESKAQNLKDKINEYSTNENKLSPLYYGVFGAVHRVLGRDLIENSEKNVYRLKDGELVYLTEYEKADSAWEYVSDFAEWLRGNDTAFMYLLPACKNDDSQKDYPAGFGTGYDKTAEEFLQYLSDNGIEYLDAKESLLGIDPEFDNWFYETDHHWNVHAAVAVAEAEAKALSERFGISCDMSVFGEENYTPKVFPKSFLGSLGRKVTMGYVEPEDLEILYPRFDTEFHIEIKQNKIDMTGDFGETLINENIIKAGYSTKSSYEAFLYGDRKLIRIENKKCENDTRVLVLKQSNADVVNPYFACSVKYMDIIDPRNFNGSIRTFIKETKPDAVVILASFPGSEDTPWTLK